MPSHRSGTDTRTQQLEYAIPPAVLWALHGLAGVDLSLLWLVLFSACWPLAAELVALAPGANRISRALAFAVESALPLGLLWLAVRLGAPALPPWLQAAAVLDVFLLRLGWRRWLRFAEREDARPLAEALRGLLIGALAYGVMSPFFTDRLLGGVDARWYLSMLTDFREQLRHGVFPVFVGQGEFAFNGAVHPFRSAPAYLYLGGAWDVLTLHQLAAPALQHLTVIGSAFGGAFGFYAALTRLDPARRWMAAATAVLYVTTPGILFPIYSADMYMSFMTVAALPWVFYANVRLFRTEADRRWDYGVLAAALAWTWFSHPPIAMYCSLLTLFIQTVRLLLAKDWGGEWKAAAAGAGLFLALAAGYFCAMSQLPARAGEPSVGRALLQVAGGMLGIAVIVRGFLGRKAAWLLAAPLVLAIFWWSQPAWIVSFGASFLLVLPWWIRRPAAGAERSPGSQWLVTVAALTGGIVIGNMFFAGRPELLEGNTARWLDYLRPVSADATQPPDCQLGWGLALLGAAGVGAAFWVGSLPVQILAALAALGVATFWSVPGFSRFWVGYFPPALVDIMNLPMALRMMPVAAAMFAVLGFTALARLLQLQPRAARVVLAGFAVSVGWSAWEAHKLVARGRAITSTRQATADFFISENRHLDRVAYDLLPISPYHGYGAIEPQLESRILNPDGSLREGHRSAAERMEDAATRRITLRSAVMPSAPAWLELSPAIELAPQESVLLRFEFFAKPYDGYFIMKNDRVYREYALPRSGQPLAFGTTAAASHVLVLRNTAGVPAKISCYFVRTGTFAGGDDFGDFARVAISRFQPDRLAVRTRALIPYQADVTLDSAGWLETPRVFLPGYRAWIDGKETKVERSRRGLAAVALPAGEHAVILKFSGTASLWAAGAISLAAWLGLLTAAVLRLRRAAGPGGSDS